MGFEFLEDGVTSDVTFRAWGGSLDELFSSAAEATTSVMVSSPESIEGRVSRQVSVSAAALDILLMRFLDEIVFLKDADGLLLRASRVEVASKDDGHVLSAELRGEPIDRSRHALEADVKGVTLHGLRVDWDGSAWQAQVTLDV
jgi:SHS2 domain-containing protein